MKDKIIEILKEEMPGAGLFKNDPYWKAALKRIATRIDSLYSGGVSKQDMEQARTKAGSNDTWVDSASFRLGFKRCWEWLQPHPTPEISEEDIEEEFKEWIGEVSEIPDRNNPDNYDFYWGIVVWKAACDWMQSHLKSISEERIEEPGLNKGREDCIVCG